MDFEEFLERVLPPLGLAPRPHRRRGVRRRLIRRMEALGLRDWADYAERVVSDPAERGGLPALLGVTISRFWRNRGLWEWLAGVLPTLCREGVRAWSCGCASGEEPYSLAMLWREHCPHRLGCLATDIDPVVLARAEAGLYPPGSLRELPAPLKAKYFSPERGGLRIGPEARRLVTFRRHDVLREPLPGRFDLIMCRNMAFTYFGPEARIEAARRLAAALTPGGLLVIGRKESLPEEAAPNFTEAGYPGVFERLP
jgi:chemotaxis methyl-accepting protein methylase